MQAHTYTLILNSAGLLADIAGAIILFKYTYVPSRKPQSNSGMDALRQGVHYLYVDKPLEKKEKLWNPIGLYSLIFGFTLQLIVVWCP